MLLAYLAGSISPSLTALRLVSVVFAVASMPVIAALVARLTDKRTALVATALAAASWITIYHGIYARMYSLFLFLSALSFLTLLRAVGTRDPKRWAAWVAAMVLTHRDAAVRDLRARRTGRLRPGAQSEARVAAPAGRDLRSGSSSCSSRRSGSSTACSRRASASASPARATRSCGSPVDVLEYVWHTIGDFGAGWTAATAVIAALAVLGGVVLFRTRPAAVLLAATVLLVPTLALMVARSQSSVFLESRHLIFALPFFQMLVAAGLLRLAGFAGRAEAAVVLVGLTALLGVEFAWGWHRTPYMYAGEPAAREQAREEAAAWLAATSRPDDILFGYEPLYLDAREAGAPFGSVIVQRADPRLAIESLDEAAKPLGRGVWVFDASDQSDLEPRQAHHPGDRPRADLRVARVGPVPRHQDEGAGAGRGGLLPRHRGGRARGAGPRRRGREHQPADRGHRAQQAREPLAGGGFLAGLALERLRVAGSFLEGGEAGRRLALRDGEGRASGPRRRGRLRYRRSLRSGRSGSVSRARSPRERL